MRIQNAGWQRLSAITITPEEGERYQGVVGLKAIPGGVPEDYLRSEQQLPTRLFIRTAMSTVNRRQVECCFR